jgi:hypothetical protein
MARERLNQMIKIRVSERDRQMLDELRRRLPISVFVRFMIQQRYEGTAPCPRCGPVAGTCARRTTS